MFDYKIIEKNRCQLGEAPIWHRNNKSFYWLDYIDNIIFKYNSVSQEVEFIKLSLETPLGGLVQFDQFNKFLIGAVNGIFLFDFDKNNSKLFLDPEEGNKNIIYNDLKIDNSKRLWVSTSHKDEKLPEGSLWCINRDLSYKRIDTNFIVSNGPAFSKDGKNIYFSDSFNRTIYKYNNSKNLNLIKSEKFYEFKEEDGFPDGLTVDINGNIWVAHWNGGKISQISSSGKLLKEIKLPSMNITSLCFGGDNFKELFITSAKEEVSESEFKKFPESGSSFLISPNSIGYESEIWES